MMLFLDHILNLNNHVEKVDKISIMKDCKLDIISIQAAST